MLAAVGGQAAGFESLGGSHFLGGRKRAAPPAAVPSEVAPSARLPTQPGQSVPSRTPIPTSSARPGKGTNQRIPYARYLFTTPDDILGPR